MTRNNVAATGQVVASAAEVYEAFFVPGLFSQWTDKTLDIAGVVPGDDVLDVGCGTGVLTRAAARRLAGRGTCIGVDINPGMLAVARRAGEAITWREAPAEALPFDDNRFDRVLSQFALMFLQDRAAALAEMSRVVRATGSVTVSTWVRVEESPGYDAMVRLLDRLFGSDVANVLLAPFTIGTAGELAELLSVCLDDVTVVRADGRARFPSIEAWVHTDIRGWTLAEMIDDAQYAELLAAAQHELVCFTDRAGRVEFAAPALLATGRPRTRRPPAR